MNSAAALQTEGYLPQANVAFIDEVFKANSAILNTLLTVLNERLFDNGAVRETVPLLCLVRLVPFAEATMLRQLDCIPSIICSAWFTTQQS